MIQVSGLNKSYGDSFAIKDLTFSIRKGEICGLIGPNGAGKTTTLKILTGFLRADAGTISISGWNPIEFSPTLKNMIGYLPETDPLYPQMTPYEFLSFIAEARQIPKQEEALAFAMESCFLQDIWGTPIAKLSKGMRHRVLLCSSDSPQPRASHP